MESQLNIRMNVCKSWSCPNLGVADASDYVYPVYRLGYTALECQKCGSLPPLFDEAECNAWFKQLMKEKLGATGLGCPHCFNPDVIRYGKTNAGNARMQCRACRKTFTPHQVTPRQSENIQQVLSQLSVGDHQSETPAYRTLTQAMGWCEGALHDTFSVVRQIATQIFILPFQGKIAQQKLYTIVSTDAESGRVLQISTNYSPWKTSEALCYRGGESMVQERVNSCTVEHIRQQEGQFMQRSQFDEIDYGRAQLKENSQGCIVRPVMAIHGHFQRLKRRYPRVSDHYLMHECMLRGAAITAWAPEVRSGAMHLWFVVEDTSEIAMPEMEFRHTGTWRIGWWTNQWQRWSRGDAHKMIALLTGQKQVAHPAAVSLRTCQQFYDWLMAHPWHQHSGKFSARTLSAQLVCLAYSYNQQHQAAATEK